MANNDEQHLTGEYLLTEWEGAHKASGIGKRAWVRKAYPGMTYGQWWGKVYRFQQSKAGKLAPQEQWFMQDIAPEMELSGDWMVIGDVHVPCTDYGFAQLVTAIAEKHLPNCQGLIVAGDLLNADAYSKYSSLISLPSFNTEIQAAKHLVELWLETFPRVVWLMGNHDARFLTHDNGQITADMLKDIITHNGRVELSIWDRCFVNTDNGRWVVAHGASYSRNQLNNPAEYALQFQCNVISHHEHHFGLGMDKYRRYTVVNNGGLFDPKKMLYARLKTTNKPAMAQGFVMLRGGYPYLFGSDGFTDWDMWLIDDDMVHIAADQVIA